MGKEIKFDTDKKFVIITENGVLAAKMDPAEIMSYLLFAYLDMWNEHCNKIDMMKAVDQVMELLSQMDSEEKEDIDNIGEILRYLFGDD